MQFNAEGFHAQLFGQGHQCSAFTGAGIQDTAAMQGGDML
jgi:hypothetical protein